MKKLILAITLVSSFSTFAACEFNLNVKKEGAKTAYTQNGTSVSSKIREALTAQGCKITYKVMSEKEVIQMNIENAEKRLAKLKSKLDK